MTTLAIGPAVMVNRLVLEEGDTATPHLAKVAKLRADLIEGALDARAKKLEKHPDEPKPPLELDTGTVVDLLA